MIEEKLTRPMAELMLMTEMLGRVDEAQRILCSCDYDSIVGHQLDEDPHSKRTVQFTLELNDIRERLVNLRIDLANAMPECKVSCWVLTLPA